MEQKGRKLGIYFCLSRSKSELFDVLTDCHNGYSIVKSHLVACKTALVEEQDVPSVTESTINSATITKTRRNALNNI